MLLNCIARIKQAPEDEAETSMLCESNRDAGDIYTAQTSSRARAPDHHEVMLFAGQEPSYGLLWRKEERTSVSTES